MENLSAVGFRPSWQVFLETREDAGEGKVADTRPPEAAGDPLALRGPRGSFLRGRWASRVETGSLARDTLRL